MVSASKEDLLKFLDYTADRGLVKKSTARSLKAACNTVFSVLDPAEEADIFAIDLDSVVQRYENKKGMEVSPGTMRSYRQRVNQAVLDFQRYKDNPSSWKPLGAQRSPSTTKRPVKRSGTTQGEPNQAEVQGPSSAQSLAADKITHQFPLRHDVIVRISGIPFDVTRAEMGRMNAFLSNLVAVDEDNDAAPKMLNSPAAETE